MDASIAQNHMFVSTHLGDESAFPSWSAITRFCICIFEEVVSATNAVDMWSIDSIAVEQNEKAPSKRNYLMAKSEREGQSLNRSFAQEVHNAAVKFEPLNLAPIKIATKHLIAVGGKIAPLVLGALNFQTSLKLHALAA
jgi:hypothetical protein